MAPFVVTSTVKRIATEECQSSRPMYEFTLEIQAPADSLRLEHALRAARFEFHRSFVTQRTQVLLQPPFLVRRTCWAEHVVEIQCHFWGCKDPVTVRHLVRLHPRKLDPTSPSGCALETNPPPPKPSPHVPSLAVDSPPLTTCAMNVASVLGSASPRFHQYCEAAWKAVAGSSAFDAAVAESVACLDKHLNALRDEHKWLFDDYVAETQTQQKTLDGLQLRLANASDTQGS